VESNVPQRRGVINEEAEALATGHGCGLQASIETSFHGGTRRVKSGLGSCMLNIRAIIDVTWELECELDGVTGLGEDH